MTGAGRVEERRGVWYDTGSHESYLPPLQGHEEPTMSKPINLGESQELHAADGNHVALEQKCRQLTEECTRLRARLEEVERERKDYLRALVSFLPKEEIHYSKEELLSFVGQKPTLEELIDELEADLLAEERGAGHA